MTAEVLNPSPVDILIVFKLVNFIVRTERIMNCRMVWHDAREW
jgi:hypothetical protein